MRLSKNFFTTQNESRSNRQIKTNRRNFFIADRLPDQWKFLPLRNTPLPSEIGAVRVEQKLVASRWNMHGIAFVRLGSVEVENKEKIAAEERENLRRLVREQQPRVAVRKRVREFAGLTWDLGLGT